MIRLTLAAIAACLHVLPAIAHDGVHVEGAYAVVVTPNAPTAAVYFTVENHATAEDRLVAATTDVAGWPLASENALPPNRAVSAAGDSGDGLAPAPPAAADPRETSG